MVGCRYRPAQADLLRPARPAAKPGPRAGGDRIPSATSGSHRPASGGGMTGRPRSV
jgi:hypothetical protein